jgi:uncharacterized protein YdcH (DUF465 family)
MNKQEKINLIFCQRFFANANRHICFFANTQKPKQKKQKSLFPNALLKTISLILILLITSCAPQSKESYLEDYKEFITEISENNANYTEEDWKNKDEKYEKFTGEWYEKFKDDFIWKDNILLTKYEFQYNLYKLKGNSSELFDELFKDYDQLKEQVKYYSENDMEKDLEFLLKEAEEVGKTATETLEEIFKELEIETK